MKPTLFLLLTAISLAACAKEPNPARHVPPVVTAAQFKAPPKANDKDAPTRTRRAVLAPIPAEKFGKFAVARRD